MLHAAFVSLQYEPDCPGYPTERYTVDIDGVQVANMTANEFQSRITDFSNGFATLSLPLTQLLPEKAMTVNMTKFNTVPTNMSDDMGNIVTEMVTWGTSAVFGELDLAIQRADIWKERVVLECCIMHYVFFPNVVPVFMPHMHVSTCASLGGYTHEHVWYTKQVNSLVPLLYQIYPL